MSFDGFAQQPFQQQPQDPKFNFGVEFQGALLKLLLSDGGFAGPVSKHVKPGYFDNYVHSWAWGSALAYRDQYEHFPSFRWLFDNVRNLDPSWQPIYWHTLERTLATPNTDERWLRDRTIDFVRRAIFRNGYQDARTLFAANRYDEAYDLMQGRLDEVRGVGWEEIDRGWLVDEMPARLASREQTQGTELIGTAIPPIDAILGGGAYPSFLGCWISYPKAGKTSTLVNLGEAVVRCYFKNVLHIVLEGSRAMVEARYDACFLDEFYANVKRGDVDLQRYTEALRAMQYLKGKAVIRGFTQNWDTNIVHIDEELRDLRVRHGWNPDVIIIDYGDLLRSRKRVDSETQEQTEAFKDMKALANRGYRIWTASQVRRPDTDDYLDTPHILLSRKIADAYSKIRICDFVGSINQTRAERQQGVVRYHCELFRDGPCDTTVVVTGTDFAKMRMRGPAHVLQQGGAGPIGAVGTKPLGYGAVPAAPAWGYQQAVGV